jgi:hypothetical protein
MWLVKETIWLAKETSAMITNKTASSQHSAAFLTSMKHAIIIPGIDPFSKVINNLTIIY